MFNNLSQPITGSKEINNIVVKRNGGRQILGCATALCKCMCSLGVPEKELTDSITACYITCPECGFQLVLYCSINSVYRNEFGETDWMQRNLLRSINKSTQ